jgi:multidrug efflux pump subunit AcrA (membrane-fusion protein)
LKLWLEEAQVYYAALQKDLVNTEALQKSQLKLLEYTRERHARHRDRHRGDVTRFTIRAPMGGLVVMQSIWRGGDMGQVQEGDQVNPGQAFMKIVDTQNMVVEANVNQVGSERLRVGQPATVHFDAFPEIRLAAKVYSIGALAVGGWRQNFYIRNVPVKIQLLENDPRVIPDLSASADVTLERKENTLLIPKEAVRLNGDKSFVYVKSGEQFIPRDIQLGEQNYTQAMVLAGLDGDEEVALNYR